MRDMSRKAPEAARTPVMADAVSVNCVIGFMTAPLLLNGAVKAAKSVGVDRRMASIT
jgi:hypothetical protein